LSAESGWLLLLLLNGWREAGEEEEEDASWITGENWPGAVL
jgi:hypothetical protein